MFKTYSYLCIIKYKNFICLLFTYLEHNKYFRGSIMKKNKVTATIYFACAIMWALSAILASDSYSRTINICLSCTFSCLGISYLRRSRESSSK